MGVKDPYLLAAKNSHQSAVREEIEGLHIGGLRAEERFEPLLVLKGDRSGGR